MADKYVIEHGLLAYLLAHASVWETRVLDDWHAWVLAACFHVLIQIPLDVFATMLGDCLVRGVPPVLVE